MRDDEVHGSITIRFIDGSRMRLVGPRQSEDDWDALRKLQTVLERPYLCLETEDGATIVPMANVKYIEVFPKPPKFPEYFLRSTRIVES